MKRRADGSPAPALQDSVLTGWLATLPIGNGRAYRSGNDVLVLVHRPPFGKGRFEGEPAAYGLSMAQEPEVVQVDELGEEEQVLYGAYSGLLGGSAVLLDQFVRLRRGAAACIVQVLTRVNGPERRQAPATKDLALAFLMAP
jgi:hypothetical protein